MERRTQNAKGVVTQQDNGEGAGRLLRHAR